MEQPSRTNRAITAGLSVGVGLAVSAAAFVGTIPFDGAHALVASAVVPFAIGSAAGVGIYAAGLGIADARARRDEAAASGAGASEGRVKEGLFHTSRQATPKGVPVIARAQNAMAEADAWTDIDSLMSSGSPVSCDPARSKDLYEIAFEEMARTGAQAAAAAAPRTAAASAAAAQTGVVGTAASQGTAQTTAQILGGHAAGRPQPARAAAAPVAQGAHPEPAPSEDVRSDQAVMSGLDVIPNVIEYTGPVRQALEPLGPGTEDTNVFIAMAGGAATSAPTPVAATASAPSAAGDAEITLDEPSSVFEVPVADYSGHEDMWAEALAILAEQPGDDERVAPAPIGAHSRRVLGNTDPIDPARMEAVVEGASATGRHARVNEILEEEIDRVPSQSMQSTSREYLRVIQGGTMAMPRMSAEA